MNFGKAIIILIVVCATFALIYWIFFDKERGHYKTRKKIILKNQAKMLQFSMMKNIIN